MTREPKHLGAVLAAEALVIAALLRLALDIRAHALRVVDLGAHQELTDPAMQIDGWNYGSTGIVRTAEIIAPALLSLIATE